MGRQYATQTGNAAGDTPVTIQNSVKGYDVYVDGVMVGKDGGNGDVLDGVFKFSVMGGQTHFISIFYGANTYEESLYFERGIVKIVDLPSPHINFTKEADFEYTPVSKKAEFEYMPV